MTSFMKKLTAVLRWTIALSAGLLLCSAGLNRAVAQDNPDQDDPPSRVARLSYMEGSVSFQPGGETEWVEAVRNRPMTTGDQIWADRDSRAELELGSAKIDLSSNTGVSILNLDDRTVQIQLSSGSINVRVRRMDRDDIFEIDTPNQAFSVYQPGRYRVEASEDGTYTVVSIREGEGESTGNGETYTVSAGQRATFEGTDRLNAQVEDLGNPDDFDNWSYARDRRYDDARSSRYVSRDVVGYEDLDDSGDWRPAPGYGDVWFPRVAADWAPYREGHWAWVDPWGWTWVDDEPWGYAPFHYGRWLSVEGRWGWVPGPMTVAPVYAPALVVFVGGGGGFGGNVGWFPLGPREVYVPSYQVSRAYVDRVNVSNTTVNTTVITNIYNTTIINKSTTINNVTYANRSVSGAVTAVPQQAFTSAQPVAKAAVRVNAQQMASVPMNSRAAFAPTQNSVLGAHASTANHVVAPPAAVASRPVVAKATAPPPPVPFAARQQALAAHPGQPIARQQMQALRPANTTAARPAVKQAPPGKPATPTMAKGNPAPNAPANRPGTAPPAANQPGNPPPANRPAPNNQPALGNRPVPNNQPTPGNRPAEPNAPAPNNRPSEPPARPDRPPVAQPNNRPEPNQPAPNNRPAEPPARTDHPPSAPPNNRPTEPPPARPPAAQPNNRPAPESRPEPNRPQPSQPAPNNRPEPSRPAPPPPRNEPPARPATPPPNDRPPQRTPPPAQAHPAPPPPSRPPTPEEKKRQDEQKKHDEKPQG
jgi:hypothetical protein